MYGPCTSPSAWNLCQSFSGACSPCCAQEGPIPYSEQSHGKVSAKESTGFLFPSVHLLWYFRQGKGGGMPWTGMSSSSVLLLWQKNFNLASEATEVLPSPLQAWVGPAPAVTASSTWEEISCSKRSRNRRIKGISSMTVILFHLVTSWINLF